MIKDFSKLSIKGYCCQSNTNMGHGKQADFVHCEQLNCETVQLSRLGMPGMEMLPPVETKK